MTTERDCNLIFSGVDEKDIKYGQQTYADDKTKVGGLFDQIQLPLPVEATFERLGKPNANYNRKIRVKMPNKDSRNAVLQKAKGLKDADEPWCKVYVRSDKHKVVLQEEHRLREKFKKLKSLDVNKNKEMSLIKGKLSIDGVVVDQNIFF